MQYAFGGTKGWGQMKHVFLLIRTKLLHNEVDKLLIRPISIGILDASLARRILITFVFRFVTADGGWAGMRSDAEKQSQPQTLFIKSHMRIRISLNICVHRMKPPHGALLIVFDACRGRTCDTRPEVGNASLGYKGKSTSGQTHYKTSDIRV